MKEGNVLLPNEKGKRESWGITDDSLSTISRANDQTGVAMPPEQWALGLLESIILTRMMKRLLIILSNC